jgi:hypothetical protein
MPGRVEQLGIRDHPSKLGFPTPRPIATLLSVARRAGLAAAERDVIRHCYRGLEVAELQRRVLVSLRRAVPIDAAFVATADPETLLFTGAYSEAPLAELAPLFLDNELGGGDVNAFTALAGASVHVASLDVATRRDRLASARYRDIMRPIGLGDELRAALVAAGACWGYLCLHRQDGRLGLADRRPTSSPASPRTSPTACGKRSCCTVRPLPESLRGRESSCSTTG